jgi:putative transposase
MPRRSPSGAARYLEGPNVTHECPSAASLCAAFRVEVVRRQRRSDGTFSPAGMRFEIPARYRHLVNVHVRHARWDLSRVDLVDPADGKVLCAVRPLDKVANADGVRRRLTPATTTVPLEPAGMAPLLRELLADYAATGLRPAYLPKDDKESA